MNYLEKYHEWLNSEYVNENDKAELISIANNEEEIKDRFYKDLEFGTGGLRGIIGIGTNRINIYTVGKVTKGLVNYLLSTETDAKYRGVVIAYDTRHYSETFAKQASAVLIANGIKTFLFEGVRSTPELSFAVRHLGCVSGIVITASHNPPKYNGYKVYNKDGGQITLENAKGIINEIENIRSFDELNIINLSKKEDSKLLTIISEEVDIAYIKEVVSLTISKRLASCQDKIKIVYSPLHGTGLIPIKKALEMLSYKNFNIVKSQALPDANFSTVKSPNPEERTAFYESIKLAEKIGADIIMVTDPDCDRVGLAVVDNDGKYKVLTGNEVGALLVYYMIKATPGISKKHAVIKTIVTSDLGSEIALKNGVSVFNTLTGFKFIGEMIRKFEQDNSFKFLFGYEESYGYLAGTFVRDKDAVISCALIAELAAYCKKNNTNILELLQSIYSEYGYYMQDLETFVFEGHEGQEKINNIMQKLRNYNWWVNSFKDFSSFEDYKNSTIISKNGKNNKNITLPISDVIKIIFEDNSWIAIRPSGTEPKLKIYYSTIGTTKEISSMKLTKMKAPLEPIINNNM